MGTDFLSGNWQLTEKSQVQVSNHISEAEQKVERELLIGKGRRDNLLKADKAVWAAPTWFPIQKLELLLCWSLRSSWTRTRNSLGLRTILHNLGHVTGATWLADSGKSSLSSRKKWIKSGQIFRLSLALTMRFKLLWKNWKKFRSVVIYQNP